MKDSFEVGTASGSERGSTIGRLTEPRSLPLAVPTTYGYPYALRKILPLTTYVKANIVAVAKIIFFDYNPAYGEDEQSIIPEQAGAADGGFSESLRRRNAAAADQPVGGGRRSLRLPLG